MQMLQVNFIVVNLLLFQLFDSIALVGLFGISGTWVFYFVQYVVVRKVKSWTRCGDRSTCLQLGRYDSNACCCSSCSQTECVFNDVNYRLQRIPTNATTHRDTFHVPL